MNSLLIAASLVLTPPPPIPEGRDTSLFDLRLEYHQIVGRLGDAKPLPADEARALRTRCLVVTIEHNKRETQERALDARQCAGR